MKIYNYGSDYAHQTKLNNAQNKIQKTGRRKVEEPSGACPDIQTQEIHTEEGEILEGTATEGESFTEEETGSGRKSKKKKASQP